MHIIQKSIVASLLLIGFMASAAPCLASLEPSSIAIIVNSANPESRALADYYCQRRKVNPADIITVEMPDKEEIPSALYHETIAPAIREQLQKLENPQRIRCLITTLGTPLRIARQRLSVEQQHQLNLIDRLLAHYYTQARQLTADYQQLAGRQAPIVEAVKFPSLKPKRIQQANQILSQLQTAAQAAQNVITDEKLQQRDQLNLNFWGLQGQREAFISRAKSLTADSTLKQAMEGSIFLLEQKLIVLKKEFDAIDPQAETPELAERRYAILAESTGLQTLCRVLLNDWLTLSNQETEAAFDSELCLVLWPPYALSGWVPNALNTQNTNPALNQPDDTPQPQTLMVARLDGPNPQIARRLIDDAIAAEKNLLRGRACFDARGIKNDNQHGSFGHFDDTIRRAAALAKQKSVLDVTVDDQEALLPPNTAQQVLIYFGWYSLRNYVPSCRFQTGALAVHIASFEAETLGREHPDSTVWCKRLLEEGAAATWGPVAEPYLHSFPPPDRFLELWLSSDLTLAECFYAVNPFNSWMMTLIGDPLYRPRYAASKGFKPVKMN